MFNYLTYFALLRLLRLYFNLAYYFISCLNLLEDTCRKDDNIDAIGITPFVRLEASLALTLLHNLRFA